VGTDRIAIRRNTFEMACASIERDFSYPNWTDEKIWLPDQEPTVRIGLTTEKLRNLVNAISAPMVVLDVWNETRALRFTGLSGGSPNGEYAALMPARIDSSREIKVPWRRALPPPVEPESVSAEPILTEITVEGRVFAIE